MSKYKIFDTQLNKWTEHSLNSLCDMHMLDDKNDSDYETYYKKDYEAYQNGEWTEQRKIEYVKNRGYEVVQLLKENKK